MHLAQTEKDLFRSERVLEAKKNMKAKKGKTIGKRVAVLLGTAVIAVGLTYPAAAKSNEVVAEENTEKISIETSKLTDVETLLSLAKVREEADVYLSRAREALEKTPDCAERRILMQMADFVRDRRK